MRDMHKWKDKVEFSLDNRQIFFLFFGLSVVGCFVFALGVMVGRRTVEVPADTGHDALALLEREDALAAAALEQPPEDDEFKFQEGLSTPATEGLPETRDPSVPPRPEKSEHPSKPEKAKPSKTHPEKPAKSETPKKQVDAKPSKPAKVADKPKPAASKPAKPSAPTSKPKTTVAAAPSKPTADKSKPVPAVISRADASKPPAVLASGNAATATQAKADGRTFTLQMKAFSKQEDANKLAEKLRRNGHDVRVEAADVRGRTWHRVRVGVFGSWDDALAAKTEFEQREQIIAYVVRL